MSAHLVFFFFQVPSSFPALGIDLGRSRMPMAEIMYVTSNPQPPNEIMVELRLRAGRQRKENSNLGIRNRCLQRHEIIWDRQFLED